MAINEDITKSITDQMLDKSSTKQLVFRNTKEIFERFKVFLQDITEKVEERVKVCDNCIGVSYKENNEFEAQIQFSGDVLVFNMHTNIFIFEESNPIHTLEFVKKDPMNAYCGLIEVYNFLADSLKYQRVNDTGYLICRIFFNKDGGYIIEGERPMIDLNIGMGNDTINDDLIQMIILQCVNYAIEFDLWAPPYQVVKEVTVAQKLASVGLTFHQTSKRLGFKMQKDRE